MENALPVVLLLDKAVLPDPAAVEKTYRKAVPSSALHLDKSERDLLSFSGGGGTFALVKLIPAPVPNGEADDAARFSLSGLKNWKPARHHAQLILVFRGSSKSRLGKMAEELPFVGALTKNTPSVVGVYFGTTTQQPALVEELADDASPLSALMLVTGVISGRDAGGGHNLLSKGMRDNFALPELWLRSPKSAVDLEFFFDLLRYEAERGSPIPEGDTVGRNAQQKLPVRYRSSPIAGEHPAYFTGRVMAPSLACETRLAYFAKTPLV